METSTSCFAAAAAHAPSKAPPRRQSAAAQLSVGHAQPPNHASAFDTCASSTLHAASSCMMLTTPPILSSRANAWALQSSAASSSLLPFVGGDDLLALDSLADALTAARAAATTCASRAAAGSIKSCDATAAAPALPPSEGTRTLGRTSAPTPSGSLMVPRGPDAGNAAVPKSALILAVAAAAAESPTGAGFSPRSPSPKLPCPTPASRLSSSLAPAPAPAARQLVPAYSPASHAASTFGTAPAANCAAAGGLRAVDLVAADSVGGRSKHSTSVEVTVNGMAECHTPGPTQIGPGVRRSAENEIIHEIRGSAASSRLRLSALLFREDNTRGLMRSTHTLTCAVDSGTSSDRDSLSGPTPEAPHRPRWAFDTPGDSGDCSDGGFPGTDAGGAATDGAGEQGVGGGGLGARTGLAGYVDMPAEPAGSRSRACVSGYVASAHDSAAAASSGGGGCPLSVTSLAALLSARTAALSSTVNRPVTPAAAAAGPSQRRLAAPHKGDAAAVVAADEMDNCYGYGARPYGGSDGGRMYGTGLSGGFDDAMGAEPRGGATNGVEWTGRTAVVPVYCRTSAPMDGAATGPAGPQNWERVVQTPPQPHMPYDCLPQDEWTYGTALPGPVLRGPGPHGPLGLPRIRTTSGRNAAFHSQNAGISAALAAGSITDAAASKARKVDRNRDAREPPLLHRSAWRGWLTCFGR